MKTMVIQRRLIGSFAFLLPVILLIGAGVQPSLSQTYHTNMRDIFAGVLISTGLILMTYSGYSKIDKITTNIAGWLGVMVALFPCALNSGGTEGFLELPSKLSGIIHNVSAGGFFIVLAFMSGILFTLGDFVKTKKKLKRNLIYRICSVVIILMLVLIVIDPWNNIFFTESIALMAFGFSWLVKGETLLKDK